MARRRAAVEAEPEQVAGVILPLDLTFHFGSSDRAYEHHQARDRWLHEHGVDTDDRAAVAAVERQSRLAYGAVDSLSRARIMAEGRAAHGASGARTSVCASEGHTLG